jgi:rhodanese-related sulfurtransferase
VEIALREPPVGVVDVRSIEEYDAGHIPDAVPIPFPEVAARLAELPRDREIITRCRGPRCGWAGDAVRALRRSGRGGRMFEREPMQWMLGGGRLEA